MNRILIVAILLVTAVTLLTVGCASKTTYSFNYEKSYRDTDRQNTFTVIVWPEDQDASTYNYMTFLSIITRSETPNVHALIIPESKPVSILDVDGSITTITEPKEFIVKPSQSFTARIAP